MVGPRDAAQLVEYLPQGTQSPVLPTAKHEQDVSEQDCNSALGRWKWEDQEVQGYPCYPEFKISLGCSETVSQNMNRSREIVELVKNACNPRNPWKKPDVVHICNPSSPAVIREVEIEESARSCRVG